MQPLSIVSLRNAAAVTANDNGPAVDMSAFTGNGYLVLNSSATGGAGQTSTVKLQHSVDGTTGWADTGVAFSAVDNTGASHQVQLVSFDQFNRFVRVVNTLAGTLPTVTAAVEAVGVKA